MASSDDPFLSVQSDVLSTLTTTRTLFSSYLRIRTLASTNPSRAAQKSEELASARTELESHLAAIENDLADLMESVAAVEGDPWRFGLDDAEVRRRRAFVRETGREVQGMRGEVGGEGGDGGNIAAGTGGGAARKLPGPEEFDEDDEDGDGDGRGRDDYAEFEQQQQQQMMREQEQDLDGVFRSVGVLRGQAEDMGRELEEQGGMLDEVDTLADRVGGKLQTGVKKVGEVIRKNEDGLSSCGIAVLIVVLIILLIMVIVI
jgi:member of the syntaxin family of t-SNAREs